MRNRYLMIVRVMILTAVASVFVGLAPNTARAHEVFPAILNLETDPIAPTRLTLNIAVNLEAMMAGIDLETTTDTNDAANATGYDRLRALDAPQLAARLAGFAPALAGSITLLADGTAVPLTLAGHQMRDPGDIDLARQTRLDFTADLPPGTRALQLGWARAYGPLVVRQNGVDDPFTATLRGGQISEPFALAGGTARGPWQVFAGYLPIGFDHILPKGLDHILFVLGLFFLSTHLRPLLMQVTAFTAAHTVTLALGALGWVSIPASIVEPLIAASICYVAVENILTDHLHRWRPVVVFCFGLLHGLGFASVLGDIGLPQTHFIPALLGFNVGVELGQLTVISLAFIAVGVWFRDKPWYRARISVPASVVIALIGGWWVIERVFL